MAGEPVTPESFAAFEYELFEGDPDNLRTVVATSNQSISWIDPTTLKLSHRIGRGSFGDVYLATRHQLENDYQQFHEVIVKMLHPIKDDHVRAVLDRFDNVFSKCQGAGGVGLLHGVSVIRGRICLVMKFYEESIGDKMARLKGGKLSLSDVLRYGLSLAEGISELHSKGILILNLKPCNFLLDENDQAILGDVGIPFILLGVPSPNSDMITQTLGTPSYMAPEQWQPEIMGPISFETDSWGFGCSIVEMLTGLPPWLGMSVQEMKRSVLRKQEKPSIPSGLPSPIENILHGCFKYDFRSRPLMKDIIQAFKSARNEDYNITRERDLEDKALDLGYSRWFLSKDRLFVGDTVRSRKAQNSCKPENMEVPEGLIVGQEQDGFVLVRCHGIHDPLRVHVFRLERVTHGLAPGDWVRLKEEAMDKNRAKKHSPVGILHSIDRDGKVSIGLIGMETLWRGSSSDLQMAEAYCSGQFVRPKPGLLSLRFKWPRKRDGDWATGRIVRVHPNGSLLIKFPGLLTFGAEEDAFVADPSQVELVSFRTSPGIAKKYRHLEDFHWAVRPVVIAIGLLASLRLGSFVLGRSKGKSQGKEALADTQTQQKPVMGTVVEAASGPNWLPRQLRV
ncbi:hypothetical protein SAY87_019062 [Trapa incisa]|uniref:Protein kinase domain-containing protein n=1 Tax=Trapa incisa TaxID=236973 RepID=A0AAN7K3A8_9MYRT|nr:hypothetical protein SAY87_019062 [Trapa incisa]